MRLARLAVRSLVANPHRSRNLPSCPHRLPQSAAGGCSLFRVGTLTGSVPETRASRGCPLEALVHNRLSGGRSWFRTSDPLLVSYGQSLPFVPVYSRLTCAFNRLKPIAFRLARGYSGLFWRLLCTSVHHEYARVGELVEVFAMGSLARVGSQPVGPLPSPTYDQITPYP